MTPRGCSICGLSLHDDEPDHCTEHHVTDRPTVPGPLFSTWQHVTTQHLTEMVGYLAQLQVDEATAAARDFATELGLDQSAAKAYVVDVVERARTRAQDDARIAVEHAEACRKARITAVRVYFRQLATKAAA